MIFIWTAKGDVQSSFLRNHLTEHILLGGEPDDKVGQAIIDKFVGVVMLSPDFGFMRPRVSSSKNI